MAFEICLCLPEWWIHFTSLNRLEMLHLILSSFSWTVSILHEFSVCCRVCRPLHELIAHNLKLLSVQCAERIDSRQH